MSGEVDAAIVWRGRSRFDAAPIVAIVTGLDGGTHNPKTGPLAQLWILRSGVAPGTAVADRRDYAVCGDCKLRGDGTSGSRACYVTIKNAPRAVYARFARGGYPEVEPAEVARICRDRGIGIRLGAYGDPAAIPVWILRELTEGIRWTGYTHQWRDQPLYRNWLMASCDSAAEQRVATAAGWRTFRTRIPGEDLQVGEIVCPASEEAGKRTTCDRCRLCDGSRGSAGAEDRRRSIVIAAHGAGTRAYIQLRRISA